MPSRVQLPLQCWILVAALLMCVAQRVLTRRSHSIVSSDHDKTVFVCLVGRDAGTLQSLAMHVRECARNPHLISFGLVVVVDDASQIEQVDSRLNYMTFSWQYAKDPSKHLLPARKFAMKRMYNNERYVLFLHGSKPLPDWDVACMRLLESGGNQVLTAYPSEDLGVPKAKFPYLRTSEDDRSIRIEAKDMALNRFASVACTVWLRAFSFSSFDILQACSTDHWHDGQMAQTVAFHAYGVRVFTPTFPICVRASRLGVTCHAGQPVSIGEDAFGNYPRVGIVDAKDDEELILKYGSIDVAKVVIRQTSEM